MKVFVRDQRDRLVDYLAEFRPRPLSYASSAGLREKIARMSVPLTSPAPELDTCRLDFLFKYDVFPARILVFAADWEREGRGMQPGDVIVQQAFLPPLPVSVKCVFGVRILETFCSPDRAGFRYGTLAGHAEKGESAFYFERRGGELLAVVHTHSVPGMLASRLAGPFFTYPYQQYCAGQAVRRMRAGFLAANAAARAGDG